MMFVDIGIAWNPAQSAGALGKAGDDVVELAADADGIGVVAIGMSVIAGWKGAGLVVATPADRSSLSLATMSDHDTTAEEVGAMEIDVGVGGEIWAESVETAIKVIAHTNRACDMMVPSLAASRRCALEFYESFEPRAAAIGRSLQNHQRDC